MKRSALILLLLPVLLLFSCGVNVIRGEGRKIEKEYAVASFSAIDASISTDLDINVKEGITPGITITGYENIINHIKIEVRDKTLFIAYDLDDTWTVNDDDVKVNITLPSLLKLSMSGAPDAHIKGNVTGDNLRLDVSGGCSVTIDDLNVKRFDADLSGASKLTIKSGNVAKADYDLSGAGEINAIGLQTEETIASISGAAQGEVWVTKRLDASISGAGSIKYKGKPIVIKHISGVGSISGEGEW